MYSLGEKLKDAVAVFEFYVPVAGELPADAPGEVRDSERRKFPHSLVEQDDVRLCRVFRRDPAVPPPLVDASGVSVFSRGSRCWWRAHERGGIHTLVFVDAEGKRTPQGVEHERGRYTDLNPDYSQLIEAIEWSLANREDAAAAGEVLVPEQTNPYLLLAAGASLRALEASETQEEGSVDLEADLEDRTRIPPDDTGFCDR